MPRQREPGANNALGGVPRRMPGCEVRSENAQTFIDHPGRHADVQVVAPGHPLVVVEAEALLAEQHNEWVVGRCYLSLAASAKVEALPEASLTQETPI